MISKNIAYSVHYSLYMNKLCNHTDFALRYLVIFLIVKYT